MVSVLAPAFAIDLESLQGGNGASSKGRSAAVTGGAAAVAGGGGGGEEVCRRVAASLGLPESSLRCFSIEEVAWEGLQLLGGGAGVGVGGGAGSGTPHASRLGSLPEAGEAAGEAMTSAGTAPGSMEGGTMVPAGQRGGRKHLAVLVDASGEET